MSKLLPRKHVPELKVKTVETLYGSIVSTMPFARPPLKEVLRSITGINKSNYPARDKA